MFLSVAVSRALKLEYPFFAAIAAIFSMENSIANSYRAGVNRMLGTMVGAVVGAAFIYIHPGNALLMGIGTVVFIFICNILSWNRAIPIAGVVFASIMLSLDKKNPLQYSLSRVLDTFIGIFIAVAVNYILFPPDSLKQLQRELDSILDKVNISLIQFVCMHEKVEIGTLRSEMIASINHMEAYRTEFRPKPQEGGVFDKIAVKLDLLRGILAHLKTLEELGPGFSPSPVNSAKLRQLDLCDVEPEAPGENELDIIYNYHIGKVLDMLAALKQGA